MRIGITCNKFAKSGGMERYTFDIVEELLNEGHEIVIFTKKFDKSLELVKKVQIVQNKLSLIPHKFMDLAFSKWLKKELPKHHLDFSIGCCRNDVTEVIACGGTHQGFVNAVKSGKPSFFDKLTIALEKRSFEHAKLIVAHSKLMQNELIKLYGIDKDKIKVIYPPVDATKFSPVTAQRKLELKDKYNLPKDKITFLFPSSGHIRKGYPFLKSFFENTDLPVELIVVGRPIDNLGKNITYLGYSDKIEDLYRACDYSILASIYEPFGLVGIESVLCGTPTVLADNIGCCEVIKEPALIKFEQNNINNFINIIQKLCSNNQESLHNPLDYFTYDIDIKHHVEELLKSVESSNI